MSKLSEEVQYKLNEYLPNEGHTKYLETEVYRAICKIAHDCDNNGFGNNWIYPFVFLVSVDDIHNHEILGSDFYKFYDLKKYAPGDTIENHSFKRISELVNDIYDHVATWVYNHLDNLTPGNGLDMWKRDTWSNDIINAELRDFDNFGDPDEWLNQFEAWNHIVENGWEAFENNKYNPDHDMEYNRYKGRDEYSRWRY